MESRKTRYGERYFIKSYSKDGEFAFTYSIYEYTMRSGIKDKHVYMVENTAWDGEVMCQFMYETYEQADEMAQYFLT